MKCRTDIIDRVFEFGKNTAKLEVIRDRLKDDIQDFKEKKLKSDEKINYLNKQFEEKNHLHLLALKERDEFRIGADNIYKHFVLLNNLKKELTKSLEESRKENRALKEKNKEITIISNRFLRALKMISRGETRFARRYAFNVVKNTKISVNYKV